MGGVGILFLASNCTLIIEHFTWDHYDSIHIGFRISGMVDKMGGFASYVEAVYPHPTPGSATVNYDKS